MRFQEKQTSWKRVNASFSLSNRVRAPGGGCSGTSRHSDAQVYMIAVRNLLRSRSGNPTTVVKGRTLLGRCIGGEGGAGDLIYLGAFLLRFGLGRFQECESSRDIGDNFMHPTRHLPKEAVGRKASDRSIAGGFGLNLSTRLHRVCRRWTLPTKRARPTPK